MDLIGEIVEKDAGEPTLPVASAATGFPEMGKVKKRESRFKAKRKEKPVPEDKPLSEAEKIHKENMERISKMTDEEIDEERRELLENLNPKVIRGLLHRVEERESHDHEHHVHAEGYNSWIGSVKTDKGWRELSHLDEKDVDRSLGVTKVEEHNEKDHKEEDKKKVSFGEVTSMSYEDPEKDDEVDEEVEDEEIAPKEYQLNEEESTVHFPKPKTEELDLDDPQFYDKLHEKYFPDLPKEVNKLSWMTQPLPKQVSTTYESASEVRFDFNGDMMELQDETDQNAKDVPTYKGLHHHADAPHLPGYTLSELLHLSRSVVPGQRSMSIQTLGRILYKLGTHKYSILPVGEDDSIPENFKIMNTKFEKMLWELITQLRVIESLTDAADEKKTKNLSVRSYAIEALWLWRQAGGTPKFDDDSEEVLSNMT